MMESKDRRRFYFLTSIRVFSNFFDLASLGLLGYFLSSALTNNAPPAELSVGPLVLTAPPWLSNPLILLLLIGGFFALKSFVSMFALKSTLTLLARVETKFAIAVSQYIFGGNLRELRGLSRAEIQWSTNTSIQKATSGLLGGFSVLASEFSLLLFMLAFLLYVDPVAMAAGILFMGLVSIILHYGIRRRLVELGAITAEESISVASVTHDLIDGYREIFSVGAVDYFLRTFQASRSSLATAQAETKFLVFLPRVLIELSAVFGGLVFIWWLLVWGDENALLTGGLVLGASLRLVGAIAPAQNTYFSIQGDLKQVDFFLKTITNATFPREKSHTARMVENRGDADLSGHVVPADFDHPIGIRLSGVTFKYKGQPNYLLEKLDLQVNPGEFVGFTGPSGGGKSTLVDLILGLQRPLRGEVSFFLADQIIGIDTLPVKAIGYVSQSPSLVSGTIADNIALGLPKESRTEARIKEVVALVGLGPFIDSLEDGIHTNLGKHREHLSGGQTQRIGIARALYSRPRLLIFDESTSALDYEAETEITDLLKGLTPSVTIISIAHRLKTIRDADQIFFISEGTVEGKGTFEELQESIPKFHQFITNSRLD